MFSSSGADSSGEDSVWSAGPSEVNRSKNSMRTGRRMSCMGIRNQLPFSKRPLSVPLRGTQIKDDCTWILQHQFLQLRPSNHLRRPSMHELHQRSLE